MRVKRITSVMRGLSATMASLLALSLVGTGIAEGYRTQLDSALGTESYVTITDEDNARFQSDYATIEEMAEAARNVAIKEGEEGTVVMKNDNSALPLSSDRSVALFGLAAYAPYPYTGSDLRAGNADGVDLLQALTDKGIKVNETVRDFYLNGILNKHIEQVPNRWTGEMVDTVVYDNIYVTAPGDMATYQIVEVTPDRFESMGAPADWKSTIDKANTTAICVFARGAGEGNTYAPGSALDSVEVMQPEKIRLHYLKKNLQ